MWPCDYVPLDLLVWITRPGDVTRFHPGLLDGAKAAKKSLADLVIFDETNRPPGASGVELCKSARSREIGCWMNCSSAWSEVHGSMSVDPKRWLQESGSGCQSEGTMGGL